MTYQHTLRREIVRLGEERDRLAARVAELEEQLAARDRDIESLKIRFDLLVIDYETIEARLDDV